MFYQRYYLSYHEGILDFMFNQMDFISNVIIKLRKKFIEEC